MCAYSKTVWYRNDTSAKPVRINIHIPVAEVLTPSPRAGLGPERGACPPCGALRGLAAPAPRLFVIRRTGTQTHQDVTCSHPVGPLPRPRPSSAFEAPVSLPPTPLLSPRPGPVHAASYSACLHTGPRLVCPPQGLAWAPFPISSPIRTVPEHRLKTDTPANIMLLKQRNFRRAVP